MFRQMKKWHWSGKGAYMFGRIDLCDFVLEHPTISRFHAVLQFKKDGEAFLYDLGSTHGTFINKNQVKKKEYTKVHVGDAFRFGQSSRLYIFQGPSELMPPERDLNKLRNAKVHQEMLDREASLLRAKAEASLADGISWGMAEDAIEEATEDDADEVTWQTYTGQLTERQQKTRSKISKRMEKVYNMRKEIDAIRAKDIAQGGLTQGQQTQIARNEQRINQIMEELESLEETLNESIQESIGARSGKKAPGRTKGFVEDEDETVSDDDDFYDRTKKKSPVQISGKHQSVETADTLTEKKESIISQMEEKKALLSQEQQKLATENESNSDVGDDLDAYMTGISSQLVLDKTAKIEKELSDLQTELDRVTYLLKIADPMGEASKKRDLKVLAGATVKSNTKPQVLKSNDSSTDIQKPRQTPEKKINLSGKSNSSKPLPRTSSSTDTEKHPEEEGKDASNKKESKTVDKTTSSTEAEKHYEDDDKISDQAKASKTPAFALPKPQWLGATRDIKPDDNQLPEINTDANESDGFVNYKDRKVALTSVDNPSEIEDAAPGLIIRKRKPSENPGTPVHKAPKLAVSSSAEAEATAADAVALLLRHKRGYHGLDDEGNLIDEPLQSSQPGKENSQPKRTFGPSKPAFLDRNPDYESWVPPEGQTGDGRTSLNDRLGY
ncbi:Forkhead-associated (FHA) domain-containing protein [Dioscorea alata]|uniref:Forkhead-associated (FHA) domain-containing protein n=2 Tax=Dioscorea alata TaxID=55571 RepID=A0ACB7WLF2_DIOAL|nr:Forkhead-associated (FHA) domain-containing protein [Dioscorea alata]KAH7688955.1 Forkhead-associated (FHA) domain-containing protein [Dioscorea alata]